MNDQSLRDALEKLAATHGGPDGYVMTHVLEKLLAAHPAEPVATRSVEVPEEVVERANRAYWEVFGSERLIGMNDAPAEEAIAMRAALEAAAPLLGPRPLLDQQAVADVVYTAVRTQAGPAVASLVGTDVLGRLMELARPMPTQAELAEWLRETFTADPGGTSWDLAAECLLIALNGAE